MDEKCAPSQQPSWFLNVLQEINDFTKCLDDKIQMEQQQREACKKKTELETKLAHERKLNKEYRNQLAELTHRSEELNKICSAPLSISDNDQKRLENVKDMYQIGKDLTGIRFDFSAPPNVAKGYVKSDARKLLQPFEVPDGDSEALWTILQSTASPIWTDKENLPNN